jgi:hypothetical protein
VALSGQNLPFISPDLLNYCCGILAQAKIPHITNSYIVHGLWADVKSFLPAIIDL